LNLWLDDMRSPPKGWVWAKNIGLAKRLLTTGKVDHASLDHDLGCCRDCERADWRGVMPHCSHVGTGYDLVEWMWKSGTWPVFKPVVHSMNPAGASNMTLVIDREFPGVGKRL